MDVVSCDCVGPQQSQAKPSAFVKFFRSVGGIASSRQVAAPLLKHRKNSATCSTRIAGQAEMGSSKFQLGLVEPTAWSQLEPKTARYSWK